jgi:hypothetical protein
VAFIQIRNSRLCSRLWGLGAGREGQDKAGFSQSVLALRFSGSVMNPASYGVFAASDGSAGTMRGHVEEKVGSSVVSRFLNSRGFLLTQGSLEALIRAKGYVESCISMKVAME